jgi:hypothetical protein
MIQMQSTTVKSSFLFAPFLLPLCRPGYYLVNVAFSVFSDGKGEVARRDIAGGACTILVDPIVVLLFSLTRWSVVERKDVSCRCI